MGHNYENQNDENENEDQNNGQDGNINGFDEKRGNDLRDSQDHLLGKGQREQQFGNIFTILLAIIKTWGKTLEIYKILLSNYQEHINHNIGGFPNLIKQIGLPRNYNMPKFFIFQVRTIS